MHDFPLAQTFMVGPDQVGPAKGAYLTSVDLFFSKKDTMFGVTLELRECMGSTPGYTILPYGIVHLRSTEVNVSDNGSTATTFNFESPIFISSGTPYALVVRPDASTPEYRAIVSKLGQQDLITNQGVQNDTPGSGRLWLAASDDDWKGSPDEDLKYTLYCAAYDSSDAKMEGVQADYEFFTVDTVSTAGFDVGEWVSQDPGSNTANASTTVTTSTANNIISAAANARWTSTFANGDYITLVSNSATTIDVVQITSVDSDTQITLKDNPSYSCDASHFRNARVAKVAAWDASNSFITLEQSTTVNSSVKFVTNKDIRGDESNSSANVVSVDDVEIAYQEPVIYRAENPETDVTLEYKYSGMDANVPGVWNDRNYLPAQGYIKSKSNEVASHTGSTYSNTLKSLNVDIRLRTTTIHATPVIDLQNSSLLSYRSYVNDSSANEWKSGTDAQGSASAKYISRIVELNPGLDAEDIKVYSTVYQPSGTSIECYARLLNESDETPFKERQWTQLEMLTPANTYSSPNDREDFIELEFQMPQGPIANTTDAGALGTTVNNTSITMSSDASGTCTVGSYLYIDGGTPNTYQVSEITAVNTTVITTRDAVAIANNDYPLRVVDTSHVNQAFRDPQGSTPNITSYYNTSGATITIRDAVSIANNDYPLRIVATSHVNQAFRDPQGSTPNITSYYNTAGAKFETFKQFQLKFVLRADEAWKHPLIKDYRSIAMSI